MLIRMPRLAVCLLIATSAAFAYAQEAVQESSVQVGVGAASSARQAGDEPYRYPQPALAHTVRDLQHLSLAITLREYCADEKIPDDFVDARLAEFGDITGRKEDCRSLLDY